MQWLKTLFTNSAAKVVDSVMKGLDELFTSEEEKLKAKEILEKQMQEYNTELAEMISKEQEQLTERHRIDMASDSWLSKNIRPLSLIFILLLYTFFSISSGNLGAFKVQDEFIKLIGTWGMVIMSFYFGGRSFEKITTIIKKRKDQT